MNSDVSDKKLEQFRQELLESGESGLSLTSATAWERGAMLTYSYAKLGWDGMWRWDHKPCMVDPYSRGQDRPLCEIRGLVDEITLLLADHRFSDDAIEELWLKSPHRGQVAIIDGLSFRQPGGRPDAAHCAAIDIIAAYEQAFRYLVEDANHIVLNR